MMGALYEWPQSAAFGRAVPKSKFYEHGNVRSALREKFVDEVERITWAYKLAESTLNLRGSTVVPEIQVFNITAKGDDVSNEVLTAIDRAVRFPIIFEVTASDRTRMAAASKSLSGAAPKVGAYFTSGWVTANTTRAPLPTAIDLVALYDVLLGALLPVSKRRGESVSEATARLDKAKKLEREIFALERKLRTEPQLNRKFELRHTLKERQAALADLT